MDNGIMGRLKRAWEWLIGESFTIPALIASTVFFGWVLATPAIVISLVLHLALHVLVANLILWGIMREVDRRWEVNFKAIVNDLNDNGQYTQLIAYRAAVLISFALVNAAAIIASSGRLLHVAGG